MDAYGQIKWIQIILLLLFFFAVAAHPPGALFKTGEVQVEQLAQNNENEGNFQQPSYFFCG